MKAIVVRQYGGPEMARLEEVDVPPIGPDEVLVKVHSVTVNRTRDLNVIKGEAGGLDALPIVPGQDPAGEIVELGSEVKDRRRGDRVFVSSRITCGNCAACIARQNSDCLSFINIGIHRWGGYAEYVTAPARVTYPLPDQLSYAEGAVAMRHFPLAFQQLGRKTGVKPGEWVLVMGASGGLGSSLVQVAKLHGANVIAGAGGDERVTKAMALRADHGINYRKEDLTERVMEITGGHGVDVICENISDPTTFPAAFASLAEMGRLVTSGAQGGGTVSVNMKQLYQNRQSILGATGHDPGDIERAMDAVGSGKIKASIDLVLPLDKLTEAFKLIQDRKVSGKIVIDPHL